MRFSAEVRDGKALWYDPRRVAEFIRTLEGSRVTINIEPWQERHSDNQQRFYRGVVLPTISEHTGYEPSEVHAILGGLFLMVEKNGRNFVQSTSTLSKEAFSGFLDQVIRWAAIELQCVIEDPQ
jgi:hypothetical protein